MNLGRDYKLEPDGLRRLVASINRYLDEPLGVRRWPPSSARPQASHPGVD